MRELLAHVRVAVGRVTAALAEQPPDGATVTAAEYYRPDARFSAAGNADRIATARGSVVDDEVAAFGSAVGEVAVHGFDLADGAGVPGWLTPGAAETLQDLLLGPGRRAPDPPHFLRVATGRASDPALLERLAPRNLAFG